MKCPKKDIFLPAVTYGKNFQKEFEYDASLPEFLPNVNRPVKVDARTIIEAMNAEDNKIDLTGKLVYSFLYVSDYKDSLKYTEFEDNFTMKADFPGVSKSSVIVPDISCVNISCKMLNPRKFILKSRFDMGFSVYDSKPANIIDENTENCFFRTDTITCFMKNPVVEREYCFNESFDIGEGHNPIGEIISRSVTILPTESAAGDGYLNVKANAFMKFLYQSDGKNPEVYMLAKSLPLSFILEDSSIKSDSVCSVEIVPLSLTAEPAVDAYGENKTVNLKLCVRLYAYCMQPSATVLPTDVFSPGTTGSQNTIELQYDSYLGTDKKVFTLEKLIETKDIVFTRLLDASVVLKVSSKETVNNETLFDGIAVVTLLGDTENGVDLLDFQMNFNERLPAADVTEISLKPLEISTSPIGGSNISLRVVASAEYSRYTHVSATAVESCEFTEKSKSDNVPALLIYYPAIGDDLWKISKLYGVAPDRLRTANNDCFDGDKLLDKNIVIIPNQLV